MSDDDGIVRFDVGEPVELCIHCLCSGEFGIVDEGACVLCGFRPDDSKGHACRITMVDREARTITVDYDAVVVTENPSVMFKGTIK